MGCQIEPSEWRKLNKPIRYNHSPKAKGPSQIVSGTNLGNVSQDQWNISPAANASLISCAFLPKETTATGRTTQMTMVPTSARRLFPDADDAYTAVPKMARFGIRNET